VTRLIDPAGASGQAPVVSPLHETLPPDAPLAHNPRAPDPLDHPRKGLTMTRALLRTFVLAASALSTVACTPTVRVNRLRPAEVTIKASTRVAAGRFEGNDATQLSSELQAALGRTGHYQLVERAGIDEVIREQKLVAQGVATTEGTNVQLGALQAVEAILTGDGERDFQMSRSANYETCSRQEGPARKPRTVQYACTRHVVEGRLVYRAHLRLIDVSTGGVIVTKAYKVNDPFRREAYDRMPSAPDSDAMISQARSRVVGRFLRVVAPYRVQESVELVTDGALPQLEEGNKFAELGNWSEAQRRYDAAAVAVSSPGASPYKPETRARAVYALGLSLVMQGDFDHGLPQLDNARRLKPESRYEDFYNRARGWSEEAKRLSAQGVTTRKTAGAVSASVVSAANAAANPGSGTTNAAGSTRGSVPQPRGADEAFEELEELTAD